MSDSRWVVKAASVTGAMGAGPTLPGGSLNQDWRKNHAKTAISDRQLAYHAKDPVTANPALDRASFIAVFNGIVLHPGLVRGDQWTRIRNLAYKMAIGAPNDNVRRLPALKDEFEKRGHSLEYSTMDSVGMKAVTLLVG